jgi:hypothetical protein
MKFHLTEEIWREAAREKKVSASGRFENQTAGEPDGETEWLKGGGRPPNSQVFYFLTSESANGCPPGRGRESLKR